MTYNSFKVWQRCGDWSNDLNPVHIEMLLCACQNVCVCDRSFSFQGEAWSLPTMARKGNEQQRYTDIQVFIITE